MKKIHWLFIATFLALANTVQATCSHDPCVEGEALVAGCDNWGADAVTAVCARDSYCCNNSWDLTCTLEAETIGGASCSFTPTPTPTPTWPGPCDHNWQLVGTALTSGCTQCVTDICTRDAYCCDPTRSWDATCVAEVAGFGFASCYTPTPGSTATSTPTPTATSTPTSTATATPTSTPTPSPTSAAVAKVQINQVYSDGGTAGSAWTHDYVELFNAGGASQSLTGWSIQYATGTGYSWSTGTTNLSGTIGAGQYFLIKLDSNGANGSALPTADITGTTDLNYISGKVALVNSTTAISGSCPSDGSIVDFFAYGSSVNCPVDSGDRMAENIGADSVAIRIDRCADTGIPADDFEKRGDADPGPRNTSTTNACP